MTDPVSRERETARATYPAELQTVGAHTNTSAFVTSTWLAKPATATHVKLQAINRNIRYRVDEGLATPTLGFQLVVGADVLIPCPNRGISVAGELAGATVEYQWVR